MQERVHSYSENFATVVLQFLPDPGPDHGNVGVGIGLEFPSDNPDGTLVSRLYGDVPTRTKVGQALAARAGLTIEFSTSEAEADWYAELGQDVVDSLVEVAPIRSIFSWLDRPSTNRLIRLVRKARDTTFGRDE